MEELYINDILIELTPNSVSQTKQINDVGDIKNRQSNYSNNIKIPRTPNNISNFEMLGITGVTSRKPYVFNSIKYVYNSTELIVNGRGVIKSTTTHYNLVIYDGNVEMVDLLGSDTLSDLDFSAYNHNLNRTLWKSTQLKTSGYIYPYANFEGTIGGDPLSGGTIQIDLQQVCFFVHTLFDMIFTQKGYTISGSFFLDTEYLSRVITAEIGYDRTATASEIPIDFSLLFGNLKQIDFVKSIMQHNGLIFRKTRNENNFDFVVFDDLLSDFVNVDDWTDKYSNFISESYKPNYAKDNRFKYKYSDDVLVEGFADSSFYVDNVNLSENADMFTSVFTATESQLFGGSIETMNHWVLKDGNYESKEDGLRIFKLSNESGLFVYDFEPDGIGTQNDTFTLSYLTFDATLYMVNEIVRSYKGIKTILDDYRIINAYMNLTSLDIQELDFFRLKYIKQLGRYFYLNKVSNFKPNRKTKVELVMAEVGAIATPSFVSFASSELSHTTSLLACTDATRTKFYYHDGVASSPQIGDKVYTLFFGTYTPLVGNNEYWRIGYAQDVTDVVMLVGNDGIVTNIVVCFDGMSGVINGSSIYGGTMFIADNNMFGNIVGSSVYAGNATQLFVDSMAGQIDGSSLYSGNLTSLQEVYLVGDILGSSVYGGDSELLQELYGVGDVKCKSTYSADITDDALVSFKMSNLGSSLVNVCTQDPNLSIKYHNGVNPYPVVSDIVYNNSSGLNPFNGFNLYFLMLNGFYIRINSVGVVTESADALCP